MSEVIKNNMQRLDNYNLAFVTNWQCSFKDFPDLVYFAQNVTIPSLSVNGIQTPYKNQRTFMPDNRIDFGQLTITFLVDEDFNNYDTLIKEFFLQEKAPDGRPKMKEVFHDLTVTRLSSNNVPIARFIFSGCTLTNVGSISYNTTGSDPDLVVCDASFNVTRMEIENLRKSNKRDNEVME